MQEDRLMKRLAIATTILAVGVAGCGSKSTSTSPSNAPKVFTIQLKSSNEVPPITNTSEANGTGTAVITVNATRDSTGAVTGGTIDFNISLTGFPAGTSIILSHIHGPNAPAGTSASVFVNTGLSAGTAIALPNGSGTYSFTGIDPGADKINQILANPASFYFNAHSVLNPGGIVRGQLQ
jgi:hypothetical protein